LESRRVRITGRFAPDAPLGETLLMEHVPPEAFGEDYLHFYDALLTDEVSDA
jgi:hypothetical protein